MSVSVVAGSPEPGTGARAASVAVVLVNHDGERWLPGVLEGLAEQTCVPARVVAVDTSARSTGDESTELLHTTYGEERVVRAAGGTGFPEALRLGLEHLDSEAAAAGSTHDPEEWVWLLHDDSRPAPDALARLLDAARRRDDVDILGPKLREWPSLRRLLELGVTISGTGRRETGLERGEYDQGQHDEEREVLAVNTAGMLVRRRVLDELGGLDEQLPLFGNDLDFGWRAAKAGRTTLVVPGAVVFHAEAAHRGLRRTPLTGRHTHYQERRAALFTLLANSRSSTLPLQVLRLTMGTLLRMLGFVLVRSFGEALDDLAALVSVLSAPGRLRAARRRRAATQGADPHDVRSLLAPAWLPYRHGLDFVGDVFSALTSQAADVAERRRVAAAAHDPSSQAARRLRESDEDEELTDTSAFARYLTNPVALVLTVVVVVLLVGARVAFGTVSGGALSPVPSDAGDWWRLHLEAWHPLAQGSAVPAPPSVLPLALLASVLGPVGAVSGVLLLSAPFSLWGAWRFLRVVGRLNSPLGVPRWLLVLGATAWATAPVAAGMWGEGRLGLVVAAALLPWLAHATLGFADPEPDRRWRAAWRVGFLLALTASFAPVVWWVTLALMVVLLGLGSLVVGRAVASRGVWAPPATALAAAAVLLSPWWVAALVHGAPQALVLDLGRLPMPAVTPFDVLGGRVGDLGAPSWVGLVLLVLAVLSLLPRATRIPVTVCWVVAGVGVVLAVVLSTMRFGLAGTSTPAGLGVPVLLVQAALLTAAVLGGQGVLRAVGGRRRAAVALGAVLSLAAAVVPVAGLVWFVAGDDDLTSQADSDVPAYMFQSSQTADERGILVVRGSVAAGLDYVVLRDDGTTFGEDEIVALTSPGPTVTDTVSALLSRPTGAVVDALGGLGVEYVLLPAPADGSVAAGLDATSGLDQASSGDASRAWQVARPLDPDAVEGPGSWWRALLLVVQGLGVLVVLVLSAPTLRARRT